LIREGWICRACWKPNRADEQKCHRCKTPRGEQAQVESGSKLEQLDVMRDKRGRLDVEIPLLAYIVSWPLGVSGVLGVISGSLGFLGGGLISGRGTVPVLGIDVGTFVMLVAAGSILMSAFQIFVARSIQRFARWAYVVAIVITALGSLPRIPGIVPRRYSGGTVPATVEAVQVWVYLVLCILAIGLLVISLIRRPGAVDAGAGGASAGAGAASAGSDGAA
jgi:hypothetical protein